MAVLQRLQVLDTAPEAIFDALAAAASSACGTPIGLLSLVDAGRQWFKANVGLPGVSETPRDVAFCAHAIEEDRMLEVPDALLDTRFRDNPLVSGDPGVRFYAGAPLVMASGERIGTLCVIDRKARRLSPQQAETLTQLARAAVEALQLRAQMLDQLLAASLDEADAAAKREQRFRSILDAQTDLVAQAKPDGCIVYANPAYAAFFGMDVEKIVGTSLYDYVDPMDRRLVGDRLRWVMETGETISSENRMASRAGEVRWIAWTNVRQSQDDGTALLHSTGRDVSAKHRADEELRASKVLLDRTGRVAGVGGWSMEVATGVVMWSAETRRIHEVAPGFQPTLSNALEFYAPESRSSIEQAVQHALESGTGWDLELQLVTARGRHIWARAVGEVEMVDGKPARLVGAFQDITERHQLQSAVAASERFLRELTDSLPVRIAYLDRQRRYRFVNRTWCRLSGFRREDVLGRTRVDLFPLRQDRMFAAAAEAALNGRSQIFEFEELHDGIMRRFENRLMPDLDPFGQVVGFFVAGVDITERSAAEQSLRRVAQIFENSVDYVLQADHRGRILYLNPAARKMWQVPPNLRLEELSLAHFMPAETQRRYREEIHPKVRTGEVWLGRTQVLVAGGEEVPVSLMVIAHMDSSGKVERLSALMRNITSEVQAQQEAQRQASTLQSVADALPATVAVVDRDGTYRYVNLAFAQFMETSRKEIVGKTVKHVLGNAEFDRRRPSIERVLRGDRTSFEAAQLRDGVWIHRTIDYIPLRLASGQLDGFVAVGQDVTERRREEARLRALSHSDPLTGLLNRAGLAQYMANLSREGERVSLAILYIDLDKFKPVNDGFGHAAGDEVLKELARRLVRLVRPTDAVARLGGDEFVIVLPNVGKAERVRYIANQVISEASQPFLLTAGARVGIGASVGAAIGVIDLENWQALLLQADGFLYRAKGTGRGCAVVEETPT